MRKKIPVQKPKAKAEVMVQETIETAATSSQVAFVSNFGLNLVLSASLN